MKSRIIIQKEEKTIFTVKFKKPSQDALHGELDIMIDAGNNMYFEKVIAGDYFKSYTYPAHKINSVSWHGYCEKINERFLKTPIVHFKDGKRRVDSAWHLGGIRQDQPLAFPICSIFIPANLDLSQRNSNHYLDSKNITYLKINLDGAVDKRLDIFVTPKGLSSEKLLDSVLGYIYKEVDIDIFSEVSGLMLSLPAEETFPVTISTFQDDSGHDIMIRTVCSPSVQSRFGNLFGTYSLLIHDPNYVYERIVERPVVESTSYTNALSSKGLLSLATTLRQHYEKNLDGRE